MKLLDKEKIWIWLLLTSKLITGLDFDKDRNKNGIDWRGLYDSSVELEKISSKADLIRFHDSFEKLLDLAEGNFGRDTLYVGWQTGKGYGSVVAGRSSVLQDTVLDVPIGHLPAIMANSPQVFIGLHKFPVVFGDIPTDLLGKIPFGISTLDHVIMPEVGSVFVHKVPISSEELWLSETSDEEGCKLYRGLMPLISKHLEASSEKRMLVLPKALFCSDAGLPLIKFAGKYRFIGKEKVTSLKIKQFLTSEEAYPNKESLEGFLGKVAERRTLRKVSIVENLEKTGAGKQMISAVREVLEQLKTYVDSKVPANSHVEEAKIWMDKYLDSISEEEDLISPRPIWKVWHYGLTRLPPWILPDAVPMFGWLSLVVVLTTIGILNLIPRYGRLALSAALLYLFPGITLWAASIIVSVVWTIYGMFEKKDEMRAGAALQNAIDIGKSLVGCTGVLMVMTFFNASASSRFGIGAAYAAYTIFKSAHVLANHNANSPIYSLIRIIMMFGVFMGVLALTTSSAGYIPTYQTVNACGLRWLRSTEPEIYDGCVLKLRANNSKIIRDTVGIMTESQYRLFIQDLWNSNSSDSGTEAGYSSYGLVMPKFEIDYILSRLVAYVGWNWSLFIIFRPIAYFLSKVLGGMLIAYVLAGMCVRPMIRRMRGHENGLFAAAGLRQVFQAMVNYTYWSQMVFAMFWDIQAYISVGLGVAIFILVVSNYTATLVGLTLGVIMGFASFSVIMQMTRLVEGGRFADRNLERDGAQFANLEMKEFGEKMRTTIIFWYVAVLVLSVVGEAEAASTVFGLIAVMAQLKLATKNMTPQMRSQFAVATVGGFSMILGLPVWLFVPGLMSWLSYMGGDGFVDFLSVDPLELPAQDALNAA